MGNFLKKFDQYREKFMGTYRVCMEINEKKCSVWDIWKNSFILTCSAKKGMVEPTADFDPEKLGF